MNRLEEAAVAKAELISIEMVLKETMETCQEELQVINVNFSLLVCN